MTQRFHRSPLFLAPLLLALIAVSGNTRAQEAVADETQMHTLGQHPAILVKRQAPRIDTNRLILAHPAQLAVIETPTPTYAHPAVAVARMAAAQQSADLDRYMAQPPVAAAWLRHSELPAVAAATAPNHQ